MACEYNMKKGDLLIVLLIAAIVVIVLVLQPRATGGSVTFDSVRKHPFDVFADPYHPPERENPYLFGRDYSYQQVGLLEGASGMMPLFGRPHPNSTNRWEYYTMNGGLKLPVSLEGKTCNSDVGCSELMTGSKGGGNVDVLGIGSMKSFIYDTKQLRRH
jgi:hypothetical protein